MKPQMPDAGRVRPRENVVRQPRSANPSQSGASGPRIDAGRQEVSPARTRASDDMDLYASSYLDDSEVSDVEPGARRCSWDFSVHSDEMDWEVDPWVFFSAKTSSAPAEDTRTLAACSLDVARALWPAEPRARKRWYADVAADEVAQHGASLPLSRMWDDVREERPPSPQPPSTPTRQDALAPGRQNVFTTSPRRRR